MSYRRSIVSITTALVVLGSIGCCRAFHRRHCLPCSSSEGFETVSLYPGVDETVVIDPGAVDLQTIPDSEYRELPDRPKSSTAHEAPKLEPTPPPRKTAPETPPAPMLKPTPKEEPAPKLVPEKPSLPTKPSLKPGALRLDVDADKASIAVGEEVEFHIRIENTGMATIEAVELTARLSKQLQPVRLHPETAGKIQGNEVRLEPIKSLRPMPLAFKVTAKGVEAGAGQLTVEVKSPILAAGPLTQQVQTRVVRM